MAIIKQRGLSANNWKMVPAIMNQIHEVVIGKQSLLDGGKSVALMMQEKGECQEFKCDTKDIQTMIDIINFLQIYPCPQTENGKLEYIVTIETAASTINFSGSTPEQCIKNMAKWLIVGFSK